MVPERIEFKKHLRVLHLEDSTLDADLVAMQLKRIVDDVEIIWVDSEKDFLKNIRYQPLPDLILSDHLLPGYSGEEALEAAKTFCPEVPFIFVTGNLGDEKAVDLILQGASDFVTKQNLERLPQALLRSLREAGESQKRKEAQARSKWQLEILNQVKEAVITTDKNYKIIYWNKAAENLYGYAKEEALGKNPITLLESKVPGNSLDHINKIIKEKGYWLGEMERVTKSGQTLNLESSFSRLLDEEGNVKGIISITKDITAQRQMKIALEFTEYVSQMIIKNYPKGAVSVIDHEKRYLLTGGSMYEELNLNPDDFIGRKITEVWPLDYAAELDSQFSTVLNGYHTSFEVTFQGSVYKISAMPLAQEENTVKNFLVMQQDITDSRLQYLRMVKAEERNRFLFDQAGTGILMVDMLGEIKSANQAATEILGASKVELMGMSLHSFLKGATGEKLLESLSREGRDQQSRFEGTYVDKKGKTNFLDISIISLSDGSFQVVFRDLSELKQSHNQLLKEKAKLETAQKVAKFGIWEYHKAEDRMEWSSELYYIFAYNKEEDTPSLKAIDERIIEEHRPAFKEHMESGVGFTLQCLTHSTHGSKWVRMQVSVIGKNRYFSVCQDVTERKGMEEQFHELVSALDAKDVDFDLDTRLKLFLDLAGDPTYVFDAETQMIKDCNTAGWQLFNFKSKSEIMARHAQDLHFEHLSLAEVAEVIDNVDDHGFWNGQILYRKDSGELFWGDLLLTRIEGKKNYLFIARVLDVDKQIKEIQRIQLENQQLKERSLLTKMANQELEAFSYAVSHDLRAPLRHMQGFLELILGKHKEALDEEVNEYLIRIGDSIQRMDNLIAALLNLSKISTGEIKKEETNVSKMIATIAEEMTGKYHYTVHLQSQDEITVKADPNLLVVALRNLISNSWKYLRGATNPLILIGKQDREGKNVIFIKDNGVGFDMKYKDRLFQPFQRLHSDKNFEGFGVGLATTKRIIEKHGGEIWAESKPGEGATFYFSLP